MRAGEADGGRRGRWGQARLGGAGEANGGRKPPASRPSLRPNATKATGPNPVPTWPDCYQERNDFKPHCNDERYYPLPSGVAGR